MSWASSRRRYDLPPDWETIRLSVLRDADWICELRTEDVCLGTASEVDHINRGNDHSRSNLRAVCHRCHAKKSSAEGNARRRELRAQRKRPPERHPGRN
ncbi:HNH endonuclease [Mycobacterium phage Jeeves]|uniref:HNH endonuclease n=1 Tax=Mycobacterium phage Jeeves TaxID=2652402 RepID=A0A5J6T4T1_9CAUD|nr:HNH endonuclease [Mycobacterium phage Jeeves]QFG04480.1 HNH endonuclease [Mycobacterium phage Jeeves]